MAKQTKNPGSDVRENNQRPRTPLSRDRVLHEAIRLADERGLAVVGMRELGRTLGVKAMSLYNHVASKDDVLDGMVDLVLNEIDLPTSDIDWREAMRKRAVSAQLAFSRHPWASALIDARQSSGPGRLRYLESIIGTLRRAGFTIAQVARAFSLLDSYIYGFDRQRLNLTSTNCAAPEAVEAFLRNLPRADYPYLTEMAVAHNRNSGYDEKEDFEFGLNLILDGLQRILDTGR